MRESVVRWRRAQGLYVRSFLLLWLVGKIANAGTAAAVELPPLAFRPGTEFVVCAIELFILMAFIRRANEDILLGNLGLSLTQTLAPFTILHFALSGALALLA